MHELHFYSHFFLTLTGVWKMYKCYKYFLESMFPACKNIKSTFYISYSSPMKRNLHMMDIDICYWCTVFLSNTSLMGRYRMTYSGIELHFIHIEAHICLEKQYFAVYTTLSRFTTEWITFSCTSVNIHLSSRVWTVNCK